jgi:hypothetical protein
MKTKIKFVYGYSLLSFFYLSHACRIKGMGRITPILLFVLFVLSCTSNFSAIWRLSPLPATGLQIQTYA